ncbi:MAG: SufD family Fe-S cluster assembly protein [Candidatus Woesearchaeota archaeon]|jgi:Fe-S cluster assembly protein SufD
MKKTIITGIIEKPLIIESSQFIVCQPHSTCILVDMLKNDIKIHVKNNAEVFYVCMQKSGNKKARVEKNGKIHWIEIYTHNVETHTFTELLGINAHTTSTVFFVGNNTEKYKITHETIHKAKRTTSDITIFGTVTHANAYTFAKTIIEKKAYGAVAHQKLKTILLDDFATASALPEMDIQNCDVQATHNATVGHLKQEQLFYIMTRGINEKEAKRQIIYGHFTELLQRFNDEIKIIIIKTLSTKLGDPYV